MDSRLKKYLQWSLGFHGLCFVLLIFAPNFFSHRKFLNDEKVQWVSLPRGTTHQFGSPLKKSNNLPASTIQEQKRALESPRNGKKPSSMTYRKKQPVKKNEPQSTARREGNPDSKIDNALEKIKNQVAQKKVEQEAAQVPETQQGGFEDGTENGNYVSPEDPEYVLYQMKIRKKIMGEWILPMKYLEPGLNLICKIVVHMNEKGDVVETEWEQKSGDEAFDLSALRAVEKSSPLDIPPERLKYEVLNEGFIIEFKPMQAQPNP